MPHLPGSKRKQTTQHEEDYSINNMLMKLPFVPKCGEPLEIRFTLVCILNMSDEPSKRTLYHSKNHTNMNQKTSLN